MGMSSGCPVLVTTSNVLPMLVSLAQVSARLTVASGYPNPNNFERTELSRLSNSLLSLWPISSMGQVVEGLVPMSIWAVILPKGSVTIFKLILPCLGGGVNA